jgi:hypothetical protein
MLSDREREVAATDRAAPYRIWFEDALAADVTDPPGHPDEVFDRTEGTA